MRENQYIVRVANDSDQLRWDTYISSHPAASPYHLYAWKNAVEEAYDHKGYYLIAEQENIIVGVLPLIHFHLPFIINEFNSLPYCDVGNILCDSEEIFILLFKESQKICKNKKIQKMHLRGAIDAPKDLFDVLSLEHHDKVRMFLRLPESSEALMAGFKSKLRSQIRKAEKNELTFFWGNDSDIDNFFTVFSENMRDLGSPVHSKIWFQSILKHYAKHARMGIVSYKDEIIGGCILLSNASTIAIPWASTLRKFNKFAPNMLLYWNVLKYSADAGFTIFDFGRSSEGEGTYKFKKQWGAEPTPLAWYSCGGSLSSIDNADKQQGLSSKQKIANIWSKIPLPVANLVGPKIRKYINL